MKKMYRLSNPSKPTWMCTACYSGLLEIGYVANFCLLYGKKFNELCPDQYENGAFSFLSGQGHRDDEIAFFKREDLTEAIITFSMYMHDAFNKINYAIEHYGFNPDKHYFDSWITAKTLELIKKWEKKMGMSVEDYYNSKDFTTIASNRKPN